MSAEAFSNEEIEINNLPKYEEIQLNRIHPDYWKIICINILIFLGLTGIAIIILIVIADEVKSNFIPIAGIYLVMALFLFLLFKISFNKRSYAIRNKDVLYKSGIIAESTTIIPLNRIQHIELNEGLFSRMYHLGSLQIFTAGGQTGHIHIAGIPIEKARSIRDLLLKKLELIEKTEIISKA